MSAAPAHRAVSALRRFAGRDMTRTRCDLCSATLSDEHEHLFHLEARQIACACPGCALLFPEGGDARYRRLSSRAVRVGGARLEQGDFASLDIPVRLVFLCPSRVHDRVFAVYPNPGGATESIVSWSAWTALLRDHPAIGEVRPDVEGLILDHLGGRSRCFVASMDVCYRFVGLLRGQAGAHSAAFSDAMRFLDGLEKGTDD